MTPRRYEPRKDDRGRWGVVSITTRAGAEETEFVIKFPIIVLTERTAAELAARYNRMAGARAG